MHHPTDRITHTTAFVTPVVEHSLEREIALWVHDEGSIRALTTGATSGSIVTECLITYQKGFIFITYLFKTFYTNTKIKTVQ